MTPGPIAGIPAEGELIAGKYRVERVLGRGGMGVVVAAQHVALRQRVAVKFLRPEALQLPEATERFLREGRAAAAIQSEHVARVVDSGTLDNGAPYLVMEYLTGVDLRMLIRSQGPRGTSEAVDYLLQACVAMAEAHALGIVHRDLKPSNLFRADRPGAAPLVKVLDFGLSKAVDAEAEGALTATDTVMGSFHYMAPEQVRSMKSADARADIWALGAILYELLSARRPFDGATMPEAILKITEEPPTPIERFGVRVPERLQAVILRCLEKDRTRRPQTVAELAQALEPFAPAAARPLVDRILRFQHAARATDAVESPPRTSSRQRAGVFGYTVAPEQAAVRIPLATPLPPPVAEPERPASKTQPSRLMSSLEASASPPTSAASSVRGAPRLSRLVWLGAAAIVLAAVAAWVVRGERAARAEIDPERLASFSALPSAPTGLPPSPPLAAQIRLGRMLFHERRLSPSNELSCSSCHPLERYGVDGLKHQRGMDERDPARNTPSVYNLAGAFALMWDGREPDLVHQVSEALFAPKGMASSAAFIAQTLAKVPGYPGAFAAAFPDQDRPITVDNVARALAAFEGTLFTRGRWDAFLEGDRAALTDDERAGFNRFVEVGCIACHFGPTVGTTMFQKLGLVKAWPDTRDRGRYEVTRKESDWMVFRVPSLRNVARTAPYLHDGSLATLDEVVRMMARHQIGKELGAEDVRLIVSWLGSLTGEIPRAAIALDGDSHAILSGHGAPPR